MSCAAYNWRKLLQRLTCPGLYCSNGDSYHYSLRGWLLRCSLLCRLSFRTRSAHEQMASWVLAVRLLILMP